MSPASTTCRSRLRRCAKRRRSGQMLVSAANRLPTTKHLMATSFSLPRSRPLSPRTGSSPRRTSATWRATFERPCGRTSPRPRPLEAAPDVISWNHGNGFGDAFREIGEPGFGGETEGLHARGHGTDHPTSERPRRSSPNAVTACDWSWVPCHRGCHSTRHIRCVRKPPFSLTKPHTPIHRRIHNEGRGSDGSDPPETSGFRRGRCSSVTPAGRSRWKSSCGRPCRSVAAGRDRLRWPSSLDRLQVAATALCPAPHGCFGTPRRIPENRGRCPRVLSATWERGPSVRRLGMLHGRGFLERRPRLQTRPPPLREVENAM